MPVLAKLFLLGLLVLPLLAYPTKIQAEQDGWTFDLSAPTTKIHFAEAGCTSTGPKSYNCSVNTAIRISCEDRTLPLVETGCYSLKYTFGNNPEVTNPNPDSLLITITESTTISANSTDKAGNKSSDPETGVYTVTINTSSPTESFNWIQTLNNGDVHSNNKISSNTPDNILAAAGLVSATDIADFRSEKYIKSSSAALATYKLPNFDDLKSLYFDQSKVLRKTTVPGPNGSGEQNIANFISELEDSDSNRIFFISGSLDIDSNSFSTSKAVPLVIFVKDELNIGKNITYAKSSNDAGIVFIVGKNVNVDKSVTEINAVIISQGNIYTAGSGCSLASNSSTNSQLVINGSLISLDSSNPIQFCRNIDNKNNPAELVNYQPKYLVILRNILFDNVQKWSEISGQ
jgi:hypothetical protein